MASLYSLLRKGKILGLPYPEDFSPEQRKECDGIRRGLLEMASPPDCILVNISSVWEDFDSRYTESDTFFDSVTAATPPFQSMWLEWEAKGSVLPKVAVQVVRIPADRITPEELRGRELVRDGEHHIRMFVWIEAEGRIVGPICDSWLVLDEYGSIDFRYRPEDFSPKLAGVPLRVWVDDGAEKTSARLLEDGTFFFMILGTGFAALSRMNCANADLRVMGEGKFRPHAPIKIVPASVWRQIVITSVPKLRTTGHGVFEREEGDEVRAHWIRGHYADYRRGPGLFGNAKLRQLYWIPEYRKGDEAFGKVVPEYVIQ